MEYWNAFKLLCGRLWSAFCVMLSVSLAWYVLTKLVVRLTSAIPRALSDTDAAVAGLKVFYAGSDLVGKHSTVMEIGLWGFIALGIWSVGQVLFGFRESSFIPLLRASAGAVVILIGVGVSQWLQLRGPAHSFNVTHELLWSNTHAGVVQRGDDTFVLITAAGTRRYTVRDVTRASLDAFLRERRQELIASNR